jgi:8-amino-7-oxononanoate synthase
VIYKGRVIWKDPKLALYGIDFSEYKENTPEYWKGYVGGVSSSAVERREKIERRVKQKEKDRDIRKNDRRENYPALIKCNKYNRMQKLMDTDSYFYYREISQISKNKITIGNKEYINFCSNNYLGLSYHPAVKEASIKAIEKYGVSACGSRLLNGTLDLHNELEKKLAYFKGGEDCIVYSAGYITNLGVIEALATTKNDILIVDEKAHASIFDGCRFSNGEVVVFRHNDTNDLKKKLNKLKDKPSKFLLTDGVFSMNGDIAKLDEIYLLAQEYNTAIIIDDAHATGVLGEKGKGTSEYFGLDYKIPIMVGTLSKAIGCVGGFVVANKKVIHYLRHVSRPSIFNVSLPPNITASAIKSLEIIETEPEHLKKLWDNTILFKNAVVELGFNIGITETPIIPIIIGNDVLTCELVRNLKELGFFVNPIFYPAVSKKESMIRTTITASHTEEDLSKLIFALKKLKKKVNLM